MIIQTTLSSLLISLLLITGCQSDLNTKLDVISEIKEDGSLIIRGRKFKLCGIKILKPIQAKAYLEQFSNKEVGVVYVDRTKIEVFAELGEIPEIFLNEEILVRGWAEVINENCPNQLTLQNAR